MRSGCLFAKLSCIDSRLITTRKHICRCSIVLRIQERLYGQDLMSVTATLCQSPRQILYRSVYLSGVLVLRPFQRRIYSLRNNWLRNLKVEQGLIYH